MLSLNSHPTPGQRLPVNSRFPIPREGGSYKKYIQKGKEDFQSKKKEALHKKEHLSLTLERGGTYLESRIGGGSS